MRRDLIELTIKYLESIPDRVAESHFDMTDWLRGNLTGKPWECGTRGCAGGWMTFMPELQAAGLTRSNIGTPFFHGEYGAAALATLLGIEWEDAEEIFYDFKIETGPKAIKEVCQKLRTLLRRKEA